MKKFNTESVGCRCAARLVACALLAAAPILAAGCTETLLDDNNDSDNPADFNSELAQSFVRIRLAPEFATSRTEYNTQTGAVSWITGDRLAAVYGTPAGGLDPAIAGTVTASVTGTEVDMEALLPVESLPDAPDGWRLYALYPESGFTGCAEGRIGATLPTQQTAAANGGYDPAAGLLFGYTPLQSSSDIDQLGNVKMVFTHVSAYGNAKIALPTGFVEGAARKGVRITAAEPLSGTISIGTNGEIEVVEGCNHVTVSTENWGSVIFGCLPCTLSETELSVALLFEDALYEKSYTPAKLWFTSGRRGNFSVDMSDGTLYAAEGAVLWSETFEEAKVVDAGENTTSGKIAGEYNHKNADESCRVFWNLEQSALEYSGSYARYIKYSVSREYLTGNVYDTTNKNSHFTASNILLYGARKLRLEFGTTASKCTVTSKFDNDPTTYNQVVNFDKDKQFAYCDIDVPDGAGSIEFVVSPTVSTYQDFDNFKLTVLEAGI